MASSEIAELLEHLLGVVVERIDWIYVAPKQNLIAGIVFASASYSQGWDLGTLHYSNCDRKKAKLWLAEPLHLNHL